jgi:hypothetical protein
MGDEDKIEIEMAPDWKPPEEVQGLAPAEESQEEPEVIEPPEKWWTEIEDEDALKAHDRAKPWLDEAQDKARREIHSRLQPLINQRNGYLSQLAKDGSRFTKEFERASRDGLISDELLDRYEETAGKMSGAYWHLGRFDGAKGFLLELSQAAGDDSLLEDFKPRIEILEQGGEDAKLFPDFLKRLASRAAGKESEVSERKGYDKGVADGRKAAIEEMRARQRNGQGPDLARKSPGGGTALSLDRYKQMTSEERRKLSPAQIDAMTAQLASNAQRGL